MNAYEIRYCAHSVFSRRFTLHGFINVVAPNVRGLRKVLHPRLRRSSPNWEQIAKSPNRGKSSLHKFNSFALSTTHPGKVLRNNQNSENTSAFSQTYTLIYTPRRPRYATLVHSPPRRRVGIFAKARRFLGRRRVLQVHIPSPIQ